MSYVERALKPILCMYRSSPSGIPPTTSHTPVHSLESCILSIDVGQATFTARSVNTFRQDTFECETVPVSRTDEISRNREALFCDSLRDLDDEGLVGTKLLTEIHSLREDESAAVRRQSDFVTESAG